MPQLNPGDPAPDFELPDQDGNPVSLKRLLTESAVVLFFYPKDDTTGCTKEACAFRDAADQFDAKGARIVGVSSDSGESHRRFAAKYNLPFTLLSDRGGRLRKLYGVKSTLGIIPGRVTFAIDRTGIVRGVFDSQSRPERHAAEALASLNR